MQSRTVQLIIAAALLSAAPAFGQAAPNPNLVDPAAIKALKDMGTYLQSLKRFHVSTDLTGERVLADGQKLQHAASAEIDVQRPDRIRISTDTAQAQRELTYDGKTVTLFTAGLNFYSSI